MIKRVSVNELFECNTKYLKPLFENVQYPWEILPKIKSYILDVIKEGIEGYKFLDDNILVGEDVTIHPSLVIEGPAIIGSKTTIRPGAFIRGNVICGEGCVIGNSSELKNAVLLNNVQVPHYNYIGDSILGNGAHMGAGSICSNLKAGGKNVVVHGDIEYETYLRKVGAFLGDNADIGCGCVLNPGTIVGKNTSVYPLTALRGVYADNCIIKDNDNIIKRK